MLALLSERRHVLVVLERDDQVAWKSLRNVEQVHLLVPDQLNTYDVLVSDDVVFTQGALEAFLAGPTKGKGAKATASDAELERDRGCRDRGIEAPAKKAPAKKAAAKKAAAKKADGQRQPRPRPTRPRPPRLPRRRPLLRRPKAPRRRPLRPRRPRRG